MRSRSLAAVERLARTALRMSHQDVAPVHHDEIVATIRHACQDAAGRGGWPAFGAAAASELFDLVSMPLRRLGRAPRVTDAAPMGPRPPRGPLMVAHDVR